MMLRKAYEQLHGQEYAVQARTTLADKLGKYSELLAAEGSLKTALTYLSGAAQVCLKFVALFCLFMPGLLLIVFCPFLVSEVEFVEVSSTDGARTACK